MKSKNNPIFICLFSAVAITSSNLAADQLTLSSPIYAQGNGALVSGMVLISNPDYAILSNTAFASSTQGEGTYTDLVGPTFTVLSPNSFVTISLGTYQFVPGTPFNTEVPGLLTLSYAFYSVNPNSPNFDPIADYISNDVLSSPSNEVFINQQSNAGPPLQTSPVPEAGSWALAATGLLLVSCSLPRKHA